MGTATLATENAGSIDIQYASLPAGVIVQADAIDIPAVEVAGNTSDAACAANVLITGGGIILPETTITPRLTSSKFLFHLALHVDSSGGSGGTPEKMALWGIQGSTNTLIIETYWHRRVQQCEPLPHNGTGFLNNTTGDAFKVTVRGYHQAGNTMSVGKNNGQVNSNKTSSIIFYEVAN